MVGPKNTENAAEAKRMRRLSLEIEFSKLIRERNNITDSIFLIEKKISTVRLREIDKLLDQIDLAIKKLDEPTNPEAA